MNANTYIYMVRHGESPKITGNERTRRLTEKGVLDAFKVTELLKDEGVDTFISSPYSRAILTVENLANVCGEKVQIRENLKESIFSTEDRIIPDKELYPLVKRMFADTNFSLPGGESIKNCQERSVAELQKILSSFNGHKIVIGTHGLVMTLMMNFFDKKYGYDFLLSTSKPDIYRLEFKDDVLIDVKRLWKG